MKAKLQHVRQWHEDPEWLLQILARASEEWELVETESRDRAEDGGPSMSGKTCTKKMGVRKGRKGEGDLSKTPIIWFGCDEEGDTPGSVVRVKRGVARTVVRARVHRALDPKIKASDPAGASRAMTGANGQNSEHRKCFWALNTLRLRGVR